MARSIDRVCREIKAESIALRCHSLRNGPTGVTWQTDWSKFRRGCTEQCRLAGRALVMRRRRVRKDRLSSFENRGAVRVDAVKGSGCSEAFKLATIELPR